MIERPNKYVIGQHVAWGATPWLPAGEGRVCEVYLTSDDRLGYRVLRDEPTALKERYAFVTEDHMQAAPAQAVAP